MHSSLRPPTRRHAAPKYPRNCSMKPCSHQRPATPAIRQVCVLAFISLGSGGVAAGGYSFIPTTTTTTTTTTYRSLQLCVRMPRILPGLGQHPVVPVDIIRVMPQLPLLNILLDRIPHLIRRQLHLRRRLLRDLAQKVHRPLARIQRHIMPRTHKRLQWSSSSWW